MTAPAFARAEIFLDGKHVDAVLVRTAEPEHGPLERMTLEVPLTFGGFFSRGEVQVKIVIEFDPPVEPSPPGLPSAGSDEP